MRLNLIIGTYAKCALERPGRRPRPHQRAAERLLVRAGRGGRGGRRRCTDYCGGCVCRRRRYARNDLPQPPPPEKPRCSPPHARPTARPLRLEAWRAPSKNTRPSRHRGLTFDERLAQLIDRELLRATAKRIERRLLKGRPYQGRRRLPGGCRLPRRARPERSQFATLGTCHWIRQGRTADHQAHRQRRTWLACCTRQRRRRQGCRPTRAPAAPVRGVAPRHADGSFSRRLMQLARLDLIVIDDWGLAAPSAQERSDLLGSSTTGSAAARRW